MSCRECRELISLRAAAAGLAVLSAGCARPQGTLFSPINPPRVWPSPPETPRIRLVGVLASSSDLKAARTFSNAMDTALRGPRPPIRFSSPQGVAVSASNLVAVADGDGGAVHIIDLDQRTHQTVFGDGDERFGVPMGVAWAGERLFVTDAKRREVIGLDPQGRWRTRFGAEWLVRPVGVTFIPVRQELIVVDGGAHRIAVFDLSGQLVRLVGGRGTEPGQFNFPTHISCFGERLLVSDSGNARVQLLDPYGQCIQTFGKKGDAAGDLSFPKGVAWDRDGHIYVVDAHFENVQIFAETGELLLAFGEEGVGLGELSLPAGLTIDEQDRIWVADSGNHRLQVFAYARPPLRENG